MKKPSLLWVLSISAFFAYNSYWLFFLKINFPSSCNQVKLFSTIFESETNGSCQKFWKIWSFHFLISGQDVFNMSCLRKWKYPSSPHPIWRTSNNFSQTNHLSRFFASIRFRVSDFCFWSSVHIKVEYKFIMKKVQFISIEKRIGSKIVLQLIK